VAADEDHEHRDRAEAHAEHWEELSGARAVWVSGSALTELRRVQNRLSQKWLAPKWLRKKHKKQIWKLYGKPIRKQGVRNRTKPMSSISNISNNNH